MTALMWMLTWLPQVVSAMRELPKPVNLTLSSRHFIHLLRWDPGPGTPRNVFYNVVVHSERGTSWEPVVGCERVEHPLVCSLTEAFPNTRQRYYTSVTAVLGDRVSPTASLPWFLPMKDTHLDLPLLAVTPCGRFLCVDLQPPVEHLRKDYDSLEYKLRISSSSADRAQSFKKTKSLKGEVLKDLAAGKQYCVSVSFSDSLVPRESNYSQPQCAFTTGIDTADPAIAVMLCLSVVLVLAVLVLLVLTGFCCLRVPLPPVLTSIQHQEEMLVAGCETPFICLVHVEPTPPSTGGKESYQTDDSDEETEMESKGGGRGGYELKTGALSACSSSSSSSSPLSSPLSSNPSTVFLPSDLITSGSDHTHPHLSPLSISNPQPEAVISTDVPSIAGLNHLLATFMTSRSASPPQSDQRALGLHPHTDTIDSSTIAGIEPGECCSQDVNLFSLTFGGNEEEMPVREPTSPSDSTTPLLPPQTKEAKEVAMETVSTFQEDEEEECSGYMRR